MSYECKECEVEFESESRLNTHVLINHPELARSDSENYKAEVSDGHMSTEVRAEKGEQFGYQK